MAKGGGKLFKSESLKKINKKFLEVFSYDGDEQMVKIEYPEFSAVCPFSGLPDIGKVIIEYIPHKSCIELKSLKYYFISFRNVGVYQEKATNIIFNDLKKILKPKYIKVTVNYNVRGGMDVTTEMESKSKRK